MHTYIYTHVYEQLKKINHGFERSTWEGLEEGKGGGKMI